MVEITNELEAGKDEIYAMFYICPKCDDYYIIRRFKYCPNCGVELNWNLSEKD